MIKLKHKELAKILGTTVGYSHQILHRKKLKLNNQYLDEIIKLIVDNAMNKKEKILKNKKAGNNEPI